jgi:hypothetical protein
MGESAEDADAGVVIEVAQDIGDVIYDVGFVVG